MNLAAQHPFCTFPPMNLAERPLFPQVGGLTQEQIISLAYNIRSCEAQVVCVQQLNLFSKEWENVCDLLGNEWSSIASHDGEIRVGLPARPQAALDLHSRACFIHRR